jgi:branched-chain amino acid transport system ATP-binding protein
LSVLSLRDVWTYYGPISALRGISLEVKEGEIVAVLGPNGAGKTTLLRTISGLLRPKKGSLLSDGQRLERLNPARIVRLGIVQVPEGRQLFPELTVAENLKLGAYVRRDGQAEIQRDLDRIFMLFPVLRERLKQPAGTLSGGEQQMLAIARGLMARPRVLLLDEPSLGLAPALVTQLFRAIQELNGNGMTVLLAEQNARQALRISHRAYVLELGRVVLEGSAKELERDERVRQRYLGISQRSKREEVGADENA